MLLDYLIISFSVSVENNIILFGNLCKNITVTLKITQSFEIVNNGIYCGWLVVICTFLESEYYSSFTFPSSKAG